MSNQRLIASILGVAALGLWVSVPGSPALAQQQVGSSGRAHDANPQVGSGGRNNPVESQALDFRQRNDLITGNVTGGGAFQGNINYSAPGEFQGNLGSDDLFRFRAQSFQSAPTSLSATAPSVSLGGVPSVYRGFSTPTAGAGVLNAQAYQTTRVAPSGGNTTYAQIVGANPYTYTSAAQGFQDRAAQLGYTTLEGQTFAVTASPLLGLRQDQISLPGDVLRTDLGVPAMAPALREQRLDQMEQPAPTLTPEEQAQEAARDPRLQTRLEAEPFRPLLTEDYRRQVLGLGAEGQPGGDGMMSPFGQQDPMAQRDGGVNEQGQITPTLLVGRQLQGMLGGTGRGGEADAATEQRINRVGEGLMNRAAQQQQTGQRQSAYSQVLEAMQRQPDARPADPTPPAPRDPGVGSPLEPVQNEAIVQAEIDRMRALDRVYGHRAGQVGQEDADRRDPLRAAQQSEAMQQLLNQLNYDVAPLPSLAGEDQGQGAQMLREAEQALASGQYFDAENLYRQVMNMYPQDPMPRVGLVHAQLGAGMIRSAAVNLRQLFESHPEVIAARYEANLLPQEERLQWLRGELQRAIETGEGGAEPGLLLAYLGYQVRSSQLIRYGLATAESRAPRDALLPVVRAIWLDGRSGDAATGEAQPPRAEPANQPAAPESGEDIGTSMPR